MQCTCREPFRQHEPLNPPPAWFCGPRPDVLLRLPELAYVVSAWYPISDEVHAGYHCAGVLRRVWNKRSEMGIIENEVSKANEQVVGKEDEDLVSRLGEEAVKKADDAEIECQRRDHRKWLEDGNAQGELRCLVLRDLRLAAA
jgi:hypothetical protein